MRYLLAALLTLCLTSPVWAATPTLDAKSLSAQTNVTTPSYTHTRGATCPNAIATIGIAYQDATGTFTGTPVTYNGVTATQIGSTQSIAGNGNSVSLWYVLNPPAGAVTVQANFSENMNEVDFTTRTYCNVNQAGPVNTAQGGQGFDTTVTQTVTSAVGELVIDVAVVSGTRTVTVGAGQAEDHNNQSNQVLVSSSEAGAATVVMSWTISSLQTWATVGVSLKPSVDGRARQPIILQ